MTDSRQETGRRGEAYARRMMEERGYRILATNYRSPHGEIDIVAADGRGIVFVEVRARRSRAYGPPEESLTPAKRRHLVAKPTPLGSWLGPGTPAEREVRRDDALVHNS